MFLLTLSNIEFCVFCKFDSWKNWSWGIFYQLDVIFIWRFWEPWIQICLYCSFSSWILLARGWRLKGPEEAWRCCGELTNAAHNSPNENSTRKSTLSTWGFLKTANIKRDNGRKQLAEIKINSSCGRRT